MIIGGDPAREGKDGICFCEQSAEALFLRIPARAHWRSSARIRNSHGRFRGGDCHDAEEKGHRSARPCSRVCTLDSAFCTVRSPLCTLHSPLSTLYSTLPSSLWSPPCPGLHETRRLHVQVPCKLQALLASAMLLRALLVHAAARTGKERQPGPSQGREGCKFGLGWLVASSQNATPRIDDLVL